MSNNSRITVHSVLLSSSWTPKSLLTSKWLAWSSCRIFVSTVLRREIICFALETFQLKVITLISGENIKLILVKRLFSALFEWLFKTGEYNTNRLLGFTPCDHSMKVKITEFMAKTVWDYDKSPFNTGWPVNTG